MGAPVCLEEVGIETPGIDKIAENAASLARKWSGKAFPQDVDCGDLELWGLTT
ncbi:MAG TPA: hypothetical protein P5568_08880 [Acidobacteriota bacterium]|nr:hypothetical protein [Acidobacteriota bacterium]HRV08570.1 hypothetical protein [Acidobacteriota bacterium]